MNQIQKKQRLNLFFDNQVFGIIGLISTTLFLQYILIPSSELFFYAIGTLFLNVPRFFIVWKYKNKPSSYCEWAYSLFVLLNSLFSCYILYAYFPKDVTNLILVTLFITGQTAGSLGSLGTSFLCFSFFNTPLLFTWSLLIYHNEPSLSKISIFMILYLVVLLVSAIKQTKVIVQGFALEKQLQSQFNFTFFKDILKGLSHELNNHLMNIELQKEMIKMNNDQKNKNSAVEQIDSSLEKIKKLMTLVVKNPKETDYLEEVLLNHVVQGFSKSFELKTNLNIKCQLDDIKAQVNEVVLKQVFHHLLVNADEAGAKNVHISMKKERDSVLVRFWDDASKIDIEHLDKIMIPFFTTKEVNKHKGNGLALSKQYLNRMNGDIYIEDDCKTFVVKLPMIV